MFLTLGLKTERRVFSTGGAIFLLFDAILERISQLVVASMPTSLQSLLSR
jgi:hypothetical protein